MLMHSLTHTMNCLIYSYSIATHNALFMSYFYTNCTLAGFRQQHRKMHHLALLNGNEIFTQLKLQQLNSLFFM